MELEVAADAEPDQLFRVEFRRDITLVEAEQLAVKRARLVSAAGRDRDRDVLQLQPHGCMQADCRTTKALRRAAQCHSDETGLYLPIRALSAARWRVYVVRGCLGDVDRVGRDQPQLERLFAGSAARARAGSYRRCRARPQVQDRPCRSPARGALA